jgi:ribosomal protein S12 methylthiotransferase
MAVQQQVSRALNAARIGRTVEVIVDDVDESGAVGRSHWDAPDIDGSVFLNDANGFASGDIVRARIEHTDDYDAWAKPL